MRILEAHHSPFWFPLLRSYTIMSEPNLLEYHLLSSYPFYGSLSKRFGLSTKIWVCPTLSVLRQRFLLVFHSPLLSGYCAMFDEVFATLPFCLLCRLSSSRVQLNRAIHYRPLRGFKPISFSHKAVLKGRGFNPKFW